MTPRVWRGPPSANNPILYEVKLNYDYFNYVVSNGLNVDNSSTGNPVAMAAMNAEIHLPARTSSSSGRARPLRKPHFLDYRAADVRNGFRRINDMYHGKQPPPRRSRRRKARSR